MAWYPAAPGRSRTPAQAAAPQGWPSYDQLLVESFRSRQTGQHLQRSKVAMSETLGKSLANGPERATRSDVVPGGAEGI
jgi:hypothetical protein